jgi:hypothetical protein
MNKEIKERWTEALRSGEYSQTKNTLADGDGFCCLGVLCEIAAEDGVVYRADYSYHSTESPGDWSSEELPHAVIDWAGLDGEFAENPLTDVSYPGGHRPNGRENAHFSELNDDMGWNFKEIADVIDRAL